MPLRIGAPIVATIELRREEAIALGYATPEGMYPIAVTVEVDTSGRAFGKVLGRALKSKGGKGMTGPLAIYRGERRR